jgi:hypothetical protein
MKLSILAPGGTYIKPHVGPDNRRLRAHLPLAGLEGAWMRVAGEVRKRLSSAVFILTTW